MASSWVAEGSRGRGDEGGRVPPRGQGSSRPDTQPCLLLPGCLKPGEEREPHGVKAAVHWALSRPGAGGGQGSPRAGGGRGQGPPQGWKGPGLGPGWRPRVLRHKLPDRFKRTRVSHPQNGRLVVLVHNIYPYILIAETVLYKPAFFGYN